MISLSYTFFTFMYVVWGDYGVEVTAYWGCSILGLQHYLGCDRLR